MKFSTLALMAFASSPVLGGEDDLECTFGHLYLADNETANVYVMDFSKGVESDADIPTKAAFTLQVPEVGAGDFRLKTNPESTYVSVSFYGQRSNANGGGYFRIIDVGVHDEGDHLHYDAPSLVKSVQIDDCIGAAHVEFNDGTVTVHCDGYMPSITDDADFSKQVNTTIYTFDESKYAGDPLIFSTALPGAHHGVAYALDKRHILHSLPLEDRVARLTNNSLPSFFQVIDIGNKNVLHDMSNPDDKSQHCHGYHGSARLDKSFALACNDEHDGILLVDFDHSQPDTDAYASRYLPYPDGYDNHRTGTIYSNYDDSMLANFYNRANGTFHIMGFHPNDSSISTDAVFSLPASQCVFGFEKSKGEVVYVMTPTDGTLHVLEWHDNHWDVMVKKAVVPGMVACNEVVATIGVHQVFVGHIATKTLYVANVHLGHHDHRRRAEDDGHDHEPHIEVYSGALPFFPNRMAVAGVPKGSACSLDEEDDHPKTSGASGMSVMMAAGLVAVIGMFL